MKRKKVTTNRFFLLLPLALLLLLLFRPAYVNISMDGVQMQSDGTVMLEREITLKGWHLSPLFGPETFRVTTLHVDGFPYSLPRQDASPVFPRTQEACFADCALVTPDNVPVNCDFMWSSDDHFCLIHMDGYFFAADKNGDYDKILDMYRSIISIPQ